MLTTTYGVVVVAVLTSRLLLSIVGWRTRRAVFRLFQRYEPLIVGTGDSSLGRESNEEEALKTELVDKHS
jgi:hypothetical protein